MNKKRASAIPLILLCISLSISLESLVPIVSFAYGQSDGLVIDAFSGKAPFDGKGINQSSDAFSPLEEMVIYALVTYNGDSVASIFVSFQVNAPTPTLNQFRVVATNQSGVSSINFNIPWIENVEDIAFGKWTVYASVFIAGRFAIDRLTYEVGWLISTEIKTVTPTQYPEPRVERQNFVKGSEVGLEITLRSIDLNPKDVTLTIVAYDALTRPIYETVDQFKMPYGELLTYRTFSIPRWATPGIAKIRVAVYDKAPSSGGVLYSPEKSAVFNIVLRDVAIASASLSTTELYIGQIMGINVTVKNFGGISETFAVTLFYESIAIGTVNVTSLESNTERTLSFSWNTSNVSAGVYTISASASLVPEETNTVNNNYVIGQVRVVQRRTPLNQRDLYIILWVILLLFLFAILALLVFRRRKKDESETLEQMSYFM